jgi:hypothetical protein
MTPYHLLALTLLTLACDPELIRYCNATCVDKNVEALADSCGGERPAKGCEEPTKRAPVLGEEVTVTGMDPDAADRGETASIQMLGRIEEVDGAEFMLDLEGRAGFLGASVVGADGALVGIVQDERDGRMVGRVVE